MRMDPLGRVKGMGGSVAGRTRWEREESTDSRRRTCVAPELARMREGVMEHKSAGVEESSFDSSSSESSDSNASKGLGWEKREIGVGGTIVGRRGNVVWGSGEVALKVVKGLTRTVGSEVGRLSSVSGGVWGVGWSGGKPGGWGSGY
jgi:hypothetical protein